MRLLDVYSRTESPEILYRLLAERTPDESISHTVMPGWESHLAFVARRPYLYWYLVEVGREFIGAVYLSKSNEVGVAIFGEYRGKGYGTQAVLRLMEKHGPRRWLANVNPMNEASCRLFRNLGFKVIQHTYEVTR